MLSVSEGKKQRRALLRDADRAQRADLKRKHDAIRSEIRRVKGQHKETLRAVAGACRAARLELVAKAKELRARALAELREATKAKKLEARHHCRARKADHRTRTTSEVDRQRAQIRADREFRAELQRIEAWNRKKAPKVASAAVRRLESDDAVRSNIPPELVPLFERVRTRIKGTPRKTRTEAFLEYAQENEREVLEVLEEGGERLVRELEARERKVARARASTPPPRRRFTAAELAATPF